MNSATVKTGRAPCRSRFRAPARVNIIGEHTDYNDGLVLPTTTALFTSVTAEQRSDRIIRIRSAVVQDTREFDLDDIEPGDAPQWIDYAKGVAAEIEAAGIRLPGAALEVDSTIPLGGGLSSSASFELAVATALIDLAGATLPEPEIAELCQRAENRYARVACGIMDQYAVACCERGNAMLLDCRSLDVRQVSLPQNAGMLLTHSGIEHRLPDSGYNNRSDECAAAVQLIAHDSPGLVALRDLTSGMLDAWRERLGEVLHRRCRHVISENQRVHAAFAALTTGDLEQLGRLVAASHASLRDDYEVSCEEVDRLVELADKTEGVLGSRMVGAGFGGCVLSIVRSDQVNKAVRHIKQQYQQLTGVAPWMHIVQPAAPATKIAANE